MQDNEPADAEPEAITPEPEAAPEPEGEKPAEPEASPEPKPEKRDRKDVRVDQLTAIRRQLEAENEALRRELEVKAKPEEVKDEAPKDLTEAEIERRALQKAQLLLKEKDEAAKIAEHNKRCNDLYQNGVKAYGDSFGDAVDVLNKIGVITQKDQSLAEAILDTDNAPDVLVHLSENPALAAEIHKLPPRQQGLRLDAISKELGKPAPVSNSPTPPNTIGGRGSADPSLEDADMETYIRVREKQKEQRRKGV